MKPNDFTMEKQQQLMDSFYALPYGELGNDWEEHPELGEDEDEPED